MAKSAMNVTPEQKLQELKEKRNVARKNYKKQSLNGGWVNSNLQSLAAEIVETQQEIEKLQEEIEEKNNKNMYALAVQPTGNMFFKWFQRLYSTIEEKFKNINSKTGSSAYAKARMEDNFISKEMPEYINMVKYGNQYGQNYMYSDVIDNMIKSKQNEIVENIGSNSADIPNEIQPSINNFEEQIER